MISKNFEFSEQGMTIKLECLSTASTPIENKSSNVINIYAKQSSGYVIRSGKWYGTLIVDNVKQDFNVTLPEVSLNYVLVYTTTKEITHQADGSKLLPVSFSVTNSVQYTVKGSASFPLESINRLYQIEYNGRPLGLDNPLPVETDINITVHQYVDSWKVNIKTEFNGQTIWRFANPEILSGELPINFPSELLPITSTYYDGIAHVITYDSENNVIGEIAYPLRLRIPDDSSAIISSCIIQPVSTNEWLANKNIFVQGYSIPKVMVSGVGSLGSEITQIGIRYPSQYEILWGNSTEVTGNKFITDSNDVTITIYVKDSRGIISVITRVIFVEAYTAPDLSVELVPSNSTTTVNSTIRFQTFAQSSILKNSVTQRIYSNTDIIDEVTDFTGTSLSRTINLLSTSPIYVVLEDKLGNSDLYTNDSGTQGGGGGIDLPIGTLAKYNHVEVPEPTDFDITNEILEQLSHGRYITGGGNETNNNYYLVASRPAITDNAVDTAVEFVTSFGFADEQPVCLMRAYLKSGSNAPELELAKIEGITIPNSNSVLRVTDFYLCHNNYEYRIYVYGNRGWQKQFTQVLEQRNRTNWETTWTFHNDSVGVAALPSEFTQVQAIDAGASHFINLTYTEVSSW